MSKYLKTMVAAIAFLSASVAFADVRVVGNGGHIVICKDSAGRVRSSEVLDRYEARHMGTIDLGTETLSLETKVELGLKRIERLDRKLAKDLRARSKDFFKTATYYSDLALPESHDEGQVILGDGCGLHQLALQQMSPLPSGKFYIVNERFWKMLSGDDRAILVLHEVLYSYFHDKGAITSKNARLLNAMLIQNKLSDLNPFEFSNLLKRFVEASKNEVRVQPVITSASAPVPAGMTIFYFLNESFFKSSVAMSTTLADDQKCFIPRNKKLAFEVLSRPTPENPDHYKVKLRQIVPGCIFGREGAVGYLFANHVSQVQE